MTLKSRLGGITKWRSELSRNTFLAAFRERPLSLMIISWVMRLVFMKPLNAEMSVMSIAFTWLHTGSISSTSFANITDMSLEPVIRTFLEKSDNGFVSFSYDSTAQRTTYLVLWESDCEHPFPSREEHWRV